MTSADAVISAVGVLNNPLLPKIKGLDSFAAPPFTPRDGRKHSTSWASASRSSATEPRRCRWRRRSPGPLNT